MVIANMLVVISRDRSWHFLHFGKGSGVFGSTSSGGFDDWSLHMYETS
jgi:hypothetical protein